MLDYFGKDRALEIICGTTEFQIDDSTAVAIGKFDGIHRGHQKLLQEIVEKKKMGLKACLFTFDPPPEVLFGRRNAGELTTREEKRQLFEQFGIDILIEFPLNYENAAMEPEVFVKDILAKRMNAAFVAAGRDLSFGAKGKGNTELLVRMSKQLGFEVKTIDKVCLEDGTEVSSTLVRSYLEKGDMELVNLCMGAPYRIGGEIVHGNQIGRTIGFPTVNVIPGEGKLLPPYGVYFSKVSIGDRQILGLSNIGCKPTVSNQKECGVETYLYDFDEDIYGKDIVVELHHYRRPERKFDGIDELKKQMMADKEAGFHYWFGE